MKIELKSGIVYKFSKIVSFMELNNVILIEGFCIPHQNYLTILILKKTINNCKEIILQLKYNLKLNKKK